MRSPIGAQELLGTPDVIKSGVPFYNMRTCNDAALKLIKTGCFFKAKAQTMSKDYDESVKVIQAAQLRFDTALEKLITSEESITTKTKQVSEKVRQSTEKLAQGLSRIEKQADFSKLERYVTLLERADKALASLAELEQSGKLDKIATALK